MCGKGKAKFAFEWHVYEIKWDWGSGDWKRIFCFIYFFAFCGCSEYGQSKTAFVTFKDAKALEIALLLSVCIPYLELILLSFFFNKLPCLLISCLVHVFQLLHIEKSAYLVGLFDFIYVAE